MPVRFAEEDDAGPAPKVPRTVISGEPSGLVFTPLSGLKATEEEGVPREPYVANEIIDLVFVEPGNTDDDPAVSSPEFTHQLWDNEEITFIESEPGDDDEDDDDDENSFLRTSVLVRLDDLRHKVMLPKGPLTEKETRLLSSGLQPALPPGTPLVPFNEDIDGVIDAFSAETCVSNGPPGNQIHSFKVGKESYEVWLATAKDSGASELLARFEKLAIWHIETADSVDFSDDRWACMFLVRRRKGRTLFVGYYTLFTFRNPFAGSKLRICQALVLPPYQGKGLGREMMLAVYRLAAAQADVVEVTVEDPAPGFQRMRDSVDFEWASEISRKISDATDIHALPAIAQELKLTLAQTTFVLEAWQYSCACLATDAAAAANAKLAKRGGEGGDNDNDDDEEDGIMRAFRISVKRRLLRANGDLRGLAKPDMQRELETLYQEQQQRYAKLSKRVNALREKQTQ